MKRIFTPLITAVVVAAAMGLLAPRRLASQYATPVKVMNTSSGPAIGSLIDDPGRTPFQYVTPDVACSGPCIYNLVPVPASHRLVIEHLGGVVGLASKAAVQVFVSCFNCGDERTNGIYLPDQSISVQTFSTPAQLFFDAGQVPQLFVTSLASINNPAVTVSGYLVDCSAAPCAPIAH